MSKKAILLVLLGFTLFNTSSTLAQQSGLTNMMSNRASQYQLGEKDQILMNVNVWGVVKYPGQYLVPRNTDLVTLISFAGGPIEGADLSTVKIVRGGELLSSTNGHTGKVSVLAANVKDKLKTGELGKIPVLNAGDTVIIPESAGHKLQRFFGFNSLFTVITAAASVALIVDRLAQ